MGEAIRTGGILHGGDLASARARFPEAPEPWIDLSTGINPHSYPLGEIPQEAWTRLPAASDLARLVDVAAAAWRLAPAARAVAAPGTQALIQLLPRLIPARRVAVLGFTYQEHAASWAASGADVMVAATLADCEAADVAVVVNPNNPDGRRIAPAELVALGGRLAERGRTLVVDEAFADLDGPAGSLAPRLPDAGTVVLRSFGKVYGLAGLRLGFALAGPDLAGKISSALGPWAVSGPAIDVATRALADAEWLARTRDTLAVACARLDSLLVRAGFTISGGTLLFRLASRPEAADWYEHLARQGILTRPFPQRPDWIRFGIPGAESEWDRLGRALDR